MEKNFFAPLGAYHTLYRPLERFPKAMIAPTEHDTFLRRQVVQGITSADRQKAAKQLVKGKNHVTIVMRPEE